jgi:hypothetical protein
MKKFFKVKPIYQIIIVSLLTRFFCAYFYADTELANEWGLIIHNFKTSGVFGVNVALSEYHAIPKFAEIGEKVLPTIFMPPLYFYFIYFIDFLSLNFLNTVNLLIFFQIALSLISILIFHKIIIQYEKKYLSSLLTFIFAFFPINIYAAAQVSSITLQIFLVLSFFYFLLKLKKDKRTKNIVFFSFFSGLLILIRGEFFLFYFFTLTYFFFYYERKIKIILISLAVTLIVVSPYIYRNYLNFNTFVLTKSFGYNLLKGNNPTVKVEGNSKFIENRFDRKRLKIKTDNNYEINLDNLYRDEAINVLIKDPLKYLKFYFIKIFSFLLVDFNSSYPNYYNFFHLVPNFVLSLISLIGAIGALKKKGFFQFLSIFYFLNIFLFSIFFILPRYSVILLPIKLLLSIDVIKYLNRNYSKKFN